MSDRKYVFMLVDPRGKSEAHAFDTGLAAREECAARNAVLGSKWGIVGVYWRVIRFPVVTDARVRND